MGIDGSWSRSGCSMVAEYEEDGDGSEGWTKYTMLSILFSWLTEYTGCGSGSEPMG